MGKHYYKIVNPFHKVHAQKKGQVGELIGCIDETIGLQFADGKEFYFWPDEVEYIDQEKIKQENLQLMNLTQAQVNEWNAWECPTLDQPK